METTELRIEGMQIKIKVEAVLECCAGNGLGEIDAMVKRSLCK